MPRVALTIPSNIRGTNEFVRGLSDGIVFGDSVAEAGEFGRAVSDGILLGDSVVGQTDEPMFDAGTHTVLHEDDFDDYTTAVAAAKDQAEPVPDRTPRFTPSQNSDAESVIGNGRGPAYDIVTPGWDGTGKALHLDYTDWSDNADVQWTTKFTGPALPNTEITYYAQFYFRLSPSSYSANPPSIKFFLLWHNPTKNNRIQFNTHGPGFLGEGESHVNEWVWEVIDQGPSGEWSQQPVGPYIGDLFDESWHRFTVSYRPNSTQGARDGHARAWVNGTKIIDISAATIDVTPPGGTKVWCTGDSVDELANADEDEGPGLSNIGFGSNETSSNTAFQVDFSDIIVWTDN